MKTINFRFLNYKKYSKFQLDFEKGNIREGDIVFIQDKLRIWARGKEYVCDGLYTSSINADDGLIIKDKYDNTVLLINLTKDSVSVWDGKRTPISFNYTSSDDFNQFVSNVNETLEALQSKKANKSDLSDYVTFNRHTEDLKKKLNTLIPGTGVDITNDRISITVDNQIYVIVDELPDASIADPNKIYVRDAGNGVYIQYVIKNKQWVTLGQLSNNVDLSGHLKTDVAARTYQPIGDYLTSDSLLGYALNEDLDLLLDDLHDNYARLELLTNYLLKGDYATKDWATENFVKKTDVYTPNSGIIDEGGDPSISPSNPNNPSGYNLTIDDALSIISTNPVLNWVITLALNKKADLSELDKYVKKGEESPSIDESVLSQYEKISDHNLDLEKKQNVLIAGKGLRIIDDVIKTDLSTVAYSGRYADLIGAPEQITVDSRLNSDSVNPVQNKAIYEALEDKANSSDLSDYVTNNTYQTGIASKQNKLTAGHGISISNQNVISTNLDTEVYVIVSSTSVVDSPDPNKIYLVETPDGNGGCIYQQYRYKNGLWVSIGLLQTNVDLSEYLKSDDAERLYQPKRNDFIFEQDLQTALASYSPLSRVIDIETSLSDYATIKYVQSNYQLKGDYLTEAKAEDLYVKKTDVYTPYQQDVMGGGSSGYGEDPSSYPTITVDSILSLSSSNPVQNRAIKAALDLKQDKLTAGNGIEISGNTISATVDTDLFVITNDINSISTPNPNKIYLLTSVENGLTVYTEYRYINGEWISFGVKDIDIDMSEYAKLDDLKEFITSSYLNSYTSNSDFEEYKSYVERTYAKSQIVINPSSNIDIDKLLDETSPNPVENRAIKTALDLKADKSELRKYALKSELNNKADASLLIGYVTTQQHLEDLAGKQDVLIPAPGGGISIVNNQISCTIDTNVIIITDDLESVITPDSNKIYLLENIVNGKTIYIEYRWKNNDWVEIGVRNPEIDLSDYYKKYEVNNLYNNITENYLLKRDASYLYQPKRSDYVITSDLAQYTPLSRTKDIEDLLNTFVTYGDFLSRIDWIESTFVKKSDVYTPKNQEESSSDGTGGEDSGTVVVDPTVVNITVDDHLSLVSTNPVANWVIKAALDLKADKSDLNNKADKSDLSLKADSSDLQLKADKSELLDYASKADLNSKADANLLSNYVLNSQYLIDLAGKQDALTAGRGISIQNNQISSTLDTTVYLIVDTLPSEGDENKIYLLLTEDNGDIIYTEYRWYNNDWHEIGQRTPEIDLSEYLTTSDASLTYQQKGDYLTKAEASSTYQEKGNYLTKSEALSTYQPIIDDYATSEDIDNLDLKFNDYVTTTTLNALRIYIENRYQGKGEYASKDEITAALNTLQLVIDQKYVLKRDVYRPNDSEWSSESPTSISINGSSGGSSGGSGSISNMVTLTTLEYQHLVDNNLVDLNTYYFTYEDEEETTTNWTFGGTFPITLGGEGMGQFPITLN